MPKPSGAESARGPWRALVGGSVGNLVEWYDWFVYSSFAVYFASSFFPSGDPTAQLLNTMGIFAVGFLVRPIGGWLLGRLADRRGRKTALTVSVMLMSVSALLIAIAPTYEQAGHLGAGVLLVARMLQGLSVGGEYGAGVTYLVEASAPGRRGLAASVLYVSTTLGQLCGLGLQLFLQHTMSEETLHSWGWRIPFFVGAAGAAVVFYLRRNLMETEAYGEESTGERGTLRALLPYRREFVLVLALTMGGAVAYYTYTTYLTKYLSNTAGMSKEDATLVGFCALAVFVVLQPLGGMLSDRIGRRPLLIVFGTASMLTGVPLLTALGEVRTFGSALLLSLVAMVILTCYTSVNAAVKAELFPTHVRALGIALPHSIAQALFGGTTEYIALWFKKAGMESGYFWYVSGCAAVFLLVCLSMRETRDTALSPGERRAALEVA
ncbi:MFS transporter [Thermomonospora umbrina]|uniref:Putative proline/betaine transporter n=1 Tax=Thermomonospora umbrina TaxID=111806 RepID=A0A3D9SPD8_9ACTN|nr:MFS transporter [Thermomonospora umbrina]REE97836.1 MHS family alpha-ketoglutarate permease-like MFS transporter [Thermomonospora umbrina]